MIGLRLPDGPFEVLCLGAHPDDIEIGCGGTLLTLASRPGLRATSAVLTGSPERRAEAEAAARAFVPGASTRLHDLPDGRLPSHWGEVKEALEALARDVRPDVVFCPRRDDAHQDHRLVGELAPTVWRDALILEYEIPKWDGDLGRPSVYVGLDQATARRKVALLEESFASQAARDWWREDTFLGLMRLRGMECRAEFAEAFVVRKALLEP